MAVTISLAGIRLYTGIYQAYGSVVDAQNTAERINISFSGLVKKRWRVQKLSLWTTGATTGVDIDENRAVRIEIIAADGTAVDWGLMPLFYYQLDGDASGGKINWVASVAMPFILHIEDGDIIKADVPEADSNVSPSGTFHCSLTLTAPDD